MDKRCDLLIIGGGAAGLSAALYATRFKLNTVVVAREFGGTGNIAHLVDNWIGDPGISGWDLMQKFIKHVKSYEVPMLNAGVSAVTKSSEGYSVVLDDGDRWQSAMVLFANGMKHRKLEVPGEEEYTAKGVHYCYTCDGPLYKGKVLGVVGGSDSAALGSLFLAQYATKVYVLLRRPDMTAEPISVDKVKQNTKIELLPNTQVAEIIGQGGKVMAVKLDSGKTLPLDGLFVEIGHLPLNELAVSLGATVDKYGFISVNKRQETSVPGILAAGDITDATLLKQFITSASEGSIAAQTAYQTLQRESKT